jgi:ribonucleoside-triphosphate reductase
VSCTVTFDPLKEAHDLEHALNYFQYQLKGVSFLPRLKFGAFPQMPYEEITKDAYYRVKQSIKDIEFDNKISFAEIKIAEVPDKFCDADNCSVDKRTI